MKHKLIYLLGIPLLWFLVACITAQPASDRVYVLSVAPSAWLILFKEPISIKVHEMLLGGLPVMFFVGLFLLKMKVKLQSLTICSIVTTGVIWLLLLFFSSNGTAIKVPGAPFIWVLCCFNFSLCLLPFWALLIKWGCRHKAIDTRP